MNPVRNSRTSGPEGTRGFAASAISNGMKFAFFGTPRFAAIVLEKLIARDFIPETVITNPDRPVGRRKVVTPSAVKQVLLEQDESIREHVRLFQPEHKNELPLLPGGPYDCFVVAAYGLILPEELLVLPRFGTIGVHPSLLPRYRGASPIQTAILEGDREAGVSLFLMDEKVDHGPVIAREILDGVDVASMTYRELHDTLAELSGDLLAHILPSFLEGVIRPEVQDETKATYTKKFTAEDGFVDPEDLREGQEGENREKATHIERMVRALSPEPGVFTLSMSPVRIPQGDLESVEGSKGGKKRMKILEADYRDGKLVLRRIQMEGELPKEVKN